MILTIFTALAIAQTTPERGFVVHPGLDPGLAVSQVVGAAGIDPLTVQPVTIRELVAGKAPVLMGPGELQTCSGIPSNMGNVRAAVTRAENAVAYMEFDTARTHLQMAHTGMACLQEPITPESASRIYFLQGVASHADGDPDSARDSFEMARTFSPYLSWDTNFSPESKPLFDEVFAAENTTATASLSVLPIPATGSLWIDGQVVPDYTGAVSLTPGTHIIQVSTGVSETAYVTVEAGEETTLVLPSAIPSQAISWAAEPTQQDQLAQVIGAALPVGTPVYVVIAGSVWHLDAGTSEWAQLQIPTRLVAIGGGASARERLSKSMLWAGGGVAALSGVYSGLSFLRANDAYRAGLDAENFELYNDAEGRYYEAKGQYSLGAAITVSGLLIAGGGWLLRPGEEDPSVSAWFSSATSGIVFTGDY